MKSNLDKSERKMLAVSDSKSKALHKRFKENPFAQKYKAKMDAKHK